MNSTATMTRRTHQCGPRRRRRASRAAGAASALVAGTALVLTGCGAPTPEAVAARPSTSSSPSAERSQLGTDEFYKVTMTITNNSNQTLWVTVADLGNTSRTAGWDDRPSNLLPGDTETVSAYAATGGQGIRLGFQSPTTDTARATLMAQNPTVGKNNYDGTKATAPLQVKASITDGLHSTATYVLTGDA